jgi:hypothetical protein
MPVTKWAGISAEQLRRRATHSRRASARSSQPIRICSIHPIEIHSQPHERKAQLLFSPASSATILSAAALD